MFKKDIKTLSESIGLDKVVLFGLFIDSSLHIQVKVEEYNIYIVNMLSKYVTI